MSLSKSFRDLYQSLKERNQQINESSDNPNKTTKSTKFRTMKKTPRSSVIVYDCKCCYQKNTTSVSPPDSIECHCEKYQTSKKQSSAHPLKPTMEPYNSRESCDVYSDCTTLLGDTADLPSLANSSFNNDLRFYLDNDSDYSSEDEDIKVEMRALQDANMIFSECRKSSMPLQMFRPTRIIGHGTFGIVVEGSTGPYPADKVAIKIMKKSGISSSRYCKDPKSGLQSLAEITILKCLKPHRNIVGYVSHWQDQKYWYLVTKLHGVDWRLMKPSAKGGFVSVCSKSMIENLLPVASRPNDRSLAGLLRSFGGFSATSCPNKMPIVPETIQRTIFRQIAEALKFLHKNGITHRDLKDENVLVDETLNVVLIDFGHAGFYNPTDYGLLTPNGRYSTYGTHLFASPELRSNMKIHGPEGDIYAFGLMIYEANYGDLPENCCDVAFNECGECEFVFDASTGFNNPLIVDLCRWMLSPDPQSRPSIQNVLNHPWFNKD